MEFAMNILTLIPHHSLVITYARESEPPAKVNPSLETGRREENRKGIVGLRSLKKPMPAQLRQELVYLVQETGKDEASLLAEAIQEGVQVLFYNHVRAA
jgi:hypothetical protein